MKVGPYIGLYSEIITSYERNPGKVCLFVAIFKFKVALLDRVTQTVQTRLRSDRDYNTTIGSVRGYNMIKCLLVLISTPTWISGNKNLPLIVCVSVGGGGVSMELSTFLLPPPPPIFRKLYCLLFYKLY